MLGVINIVTKRGAHLSATRVVVESEILKSYRASVSAGYTFELLGKPAEVVVGLEVYRQDGPTFDFGPQNLDLEFTNTPIRFTREGEATGIWGGAAGHSYYAEVPSGVARFLWEGWELAVAASAYKRSVPYNTVTEARNKDFDDPDSYERDRTLWMDLRRRGSVTPIMEVSARVYADLHDYTSTINTSTYLSCIYPDTLTCRYTVAGLSRSVGTELQAQFDWLRSAELVTLLGLDVRLRQVSAKSDTQDYDTDRYLTSSYGVIDERDETLGVFAQQTWLPLRWLAFNAGARLDLDRRFDPVPSPRLAASVNPWPGATVKGIYSQAFRAPSWNETAYRGETQVGSDELRPETVRNLEALFEQRLGAHRVFVGAFGARWKDLVEIQALTTQEIAAARVRGELPIQVARASQFRNLSSIEEYGFNTGFDGVVGGVFRYGGNLTAAMARLESDAGPEPLPVAPSIFGNLHLSYDLGGQLPSLGLATHFLGPRPSVSSRRATADRPYAPALAEIRATVAGPTVLVPDLTYRLSANVVTAERGPYPVGPAEHTEVVDVPPELNPIDRFRVTVGLSYLFGKQR
jgi:outer membrane receptor protein involved in Fe transport